MILLTIQIEILIDRPGRNSDSVVEYSTLRIRTITRNIRVHTSNLEMNSTSLHVIKDDR